MNPRLLNPLRWRRSLLFFVLFLVLALWFSFFDTYSIRTRVQLAKEKEELIKETEQLQSETAAYQEMLEELNTNPEMLERIAREEYGMRKPGETIYRIQEK